MCHDILQIYKGDYVQCLWLRPWWAHSSLVVLHQMAPHLTPAELDFIHEKLSGGLTPTEAHKRLKAQRNKSKEQGYAHSAPTVHRQCPDIALAVPPWCPHTMPSQCLHNAFTVPSQRPHSALTAPSQRPHSALMVKPKQNQ